MQYVIKLEKEKTFPKGKNNQKIETQYNGIKIGIEILDKNCSIVLDGEDSSEILRVYKLTVELLSLYDGYFYKPVTLEIDNKSENIGNLLELGYFKTDSKWLSSEILGGCYRNMSSEVIKKYDIFRNKGIGNEKMLKSLVNSYFYIRSEDYGKINVNHRLSLLLNVADGLAINIVKDQNNIKANLSNFFKESIDFEKVKKGAALFGIKEDDYLEKLADERNMFDHYVYKEKSLSSFVFNNITENSAYAVWYFVYVVDLVIRIKILKEIEVTLKKELLDSAMDSLNDWVIYESQMHETCATSFYQMKQMIRDNGLVMR